MMDKERRRALGALTHELGIGGLDLEMLDVALTHPSYAMEHNLDHDNQRLEFLGDAVVDLIMGEYLFAQFPADDEGKLTTNICFWAVARRRRAEVCAHRIWRMPGRRCAARSI